MARSKTYKKNIFCLESLWDHDLQNRLTVVPILDLIARRHGVKFIHLTCNTPEEFVHNLRLLPRRNGYAILYLAFHGKAGRLVLDRESISLEDLAEILNKRLSNWIVHFGCCGTLSVKEFRIWDFISRTEALMVTGYKRDIDWPAGTVIDLLLLDQIQFYREMRRFWRRFNDTAYPFADLGLEAFHR